MISFNNARGACTKCSLLFKYKIRVRVRTTDYPNKLVMQSPQRFKRDRASLVPTGPKVLRRNVQKYCRARTYHKCRWRPRGISSLWRVDNHSLVGSGCERMVAVTELMGGAAMTRHRTARRMHDMVHCTLMGLLKQIIGYHRFRSREYV